jgi:microfibrillar-associated protein 1
MASNWNTAGAVPVKNEKGEMTMKKVKVHRYIAGKRPDYAQEIDESSESDFEEEESADVEQQKYQYYVEKSSNLSKEREKDISDWVINKSENRVEQENVDAEVEDRRLRRLQEREKAEESFEDRIARHRKIQEPEVLMDDDKMDLDEENQEEENNNENIDEDEQANDKDEEERIRYRLALKQKALEKQAEEELLDREEDQKYVREGLSEEDEEEEESEEEEDSESDEELAPRLKPVFVSKRDRITIIEKEREALKQRQIEIEKMQLHEESCKHTRKIIEEEIKREKLAEKEAEENIACDFITDDENDETEYEAWKLRELKRIKRDREEKENREREKEEIIRLRNMSEEERLAELKKNPKVITNLREKGHYKFLQKYYHRGAFFLHEDQEILKRDVSAPTLEDHFDKTVLPKVMQVKNFGMAGRTKYTHLADQDTTRLDDNPWKTQEDSVTKKYAGGSKQVFDKPSTKKRKSN